MHLQVKNMAQTTTVSHKKLEVFSELALDRIRKKLNGTADDGSSLTVAQQVDRVITQAADVTNLALMYPGWAPYM
jgi:phosphatidylinositol kinase/protein kinase (PI-3  family)